MGTPAEWKNRLGSIIDDIEVEGQFACSGGDCEGDVTEPLPKLSVTGFGSVRLPLRRDQAAALLAVGQPAPYGKGLDTVLDPAVRRATQLDASKVQFHPEWETTLLDITAGKEDRSKRRIATAVKPEISLERLAFYFHELVCVPSLPHFKTLDATLTQCLQILLQHGFESSLSYIPTDVASGLGIDAIADVQARLYKLLLYEPGGHFVAHRDTEKEPGMFATLVVQLPVDGGHTGGTLRVTHRGQAFEWDTAAVSREGRLSYAAFYADCEHELAAVTSGLRMVLTYNLVRVAPGSPLRTPSGAASDNEEALEAAVRSWQSTPAADRLVVIPLEHKYTETNLSFSRLKGRDAAVARLLAGCELLDVNLALVTKTVVGSVAFDFCAWKRRERNRRRYGWGWRSRKRSHCIHDEDEEGMSDELEYEYEEELSDDGEDAEMDDIIDSDVQIKKWVSLSRQGDGRAHPKSSSQGDDDSKNSDCSDPDDEPGSFESSDPDGETEQPAFDIDDYLLQDSALFGEDEDPDEREYEGYTGNAGPTLNFWYHRAVVVVWPRAFKATLACADGFSAAVGKLREQIEQLTSPSGSGAMGAPTYSWQRPKRAIINRDALMREFKALLDAVLEMAEVTPDEAFRGGLRAAEDVALALELGASAQLLMLAGGSALCRFVAALAKYGSLASGSVVQALAAATAAVTEPALDDSVLALVTRCATLQFARCAQVAQEPAMPEGLRGRVVQALMDAALGPGFQQLPQQDVLLMGRLVCEGGPAFTQYQAAFCTAVLERSDSQALLQALLKDPSVARGVMAGSQNMVALLTARLQALAERTSKGPPKLNWVQPKACFPVHPKIEAFLRGPQHQATFSGIFRGVQEARDWVGHHFHQGQQTKNGFSASAQAGGRGRQAFVTVTKYNREYEHAAQKYNDAASELGALRALASSAGRSTAGVTGPAAQLAGAAIAATAMTGAASVRGDPATSSRAGALAAAPVRLPLSALASGPLVIDLTR